MAVTVDTLAEDLRVTRARRRITARKLAGQLGLSPSTLCRAEQGKMPNARAYEQLKRWIEEGV